MHIHSLTSLAGTGHSILQYVIRAVHVLQIVVYGVVDLPRVPLGIQGGVLGGHGGFVPSGRAVYIRVPTAKGVTRSAQVIGGQDGDSRAIAVDVGFVFCAVRPACITAVQVIGQRVLIAGVIHLDHRAAVALDSLLVEVLGGESGVGLTFGGSRLTCSAGLGFRVRKGVVIVRYILLIMLHGVGDTALRCPLGIEGNVLGGHGARSKRSRAARIRVPTIKGVTRSRHIALRQELERSAQTILSDTGI